MYEDQFNLNHMFEDNDSLIKIFDRLNKVTNIEFYLI